LPLSGYVLGHYMRQGKKIAPARKRQGEKLDSEAVIVCCPSMINYVS